MDVTLYYGAVDIEHTAAHTHGYARVMYRGVSTSFVGEGEVWWYHPGGKDREQTWISGGECTVIARKSYHAIPPQTVHFRFNRKLKNHGVTSTLHVFEPSEPRLQHPRSRSNTNFIYHRNTIVPFFTLDHTLSPGCRAWLSIDCTQPLKPLNNAKFRTVTRSLRSPFHPGTYTGSL